MVINEREPIKFEETDIPKVLIADDDESMRLLLSAAISRWGYEVIQARDGEEAWELLQQPNPPLLLILDWVMPKMNGLALCERIRKEAHFHPYIIFLTQVSGATNVIRGLEAGADEFLLKPVNFEDLRVRMLAGEKVLHFLNIIDQQKSEMKNYVSYIEILEKLLLLVWKQKK